jgi:hypothetical protein
MQLTAGLVANACFGAELRLTPAICATVTLDYFRVVRGWRVLGDASLNTHHSRPRLLSNPTKVC